jgi:hypothetical protein
LTLIQLLIILGILLFLLAFLIPAVFRVREAATRTESINNLKQIVIAIHSSNDANKRMPPIVGEYPAKSNVRGTFHFHILPYLEQEPLYRQAEGNVSKNGTYSKPVPLFVNSQDRTAPPGNLHDGWLATTSYAANWLVFRQEPRRLVGDITDGTSNTIAMTERYQVCNGQPCAWGYAGLYYWTPMFAYYSKAWFQLAPEPEQCQPGLAQATNRSGIQAALADGSVRIVADHVSPQTWAYACDPNDGNPLGADW